MYELQSTKQINICYCNWEILHVLCNACLISIKRCRAELVQIPLKEVKPLVTAEIH